MREFPVYRGMWAAEPLRCGSTKKIPALVGKGTTIVLNVASHKVMSDNHKHADFRLKVRNELELYLLASSQPETARIANPKLRND
jgi:hypothetical protein